MEIEILSQDIIEQSMFFSSHLSREQADEISNKYHNKQPDFFQILSDSIRVMKLKQIHYNELNYMMIIALMSFDYYHVEIKKITLDEIGKYSEKWIKKHYDNNYSVEKRIEEMKKTMRQEVLVDFFHFRTKGNDNFKSLIPKDKYYLVMSHLCMLCEMLDNEVLKTLGEENKI